MPELPVLDASGKLSPVAHVILMAVMAYPENEQKQEEILASAVTGALQRVPESPAVTADLVQRFSWFLPAVHRAPSPGGVKRAALKASGSAWIAADALVLMLGGAIHHPDLDVHLTKALYAISVYHQGNVTRQGGKLRLGNRTLWTAWTTFRSVAHLHAVKRLWAEDHPDDSKSFPQWFASNLEEFLAAAEDLRRQAVTRRFLTNGETWSVPPTLPLPPVTVAPAPLDPEMLAILRDYRPEHSRF